MKAVEKLAAGDALKLDELKSVVKSIQAGVRKIRDTGLNEEVLLLLIQHASPTVTGHKVPRRKVKQQEVRAVLEGLDNLADYMFGEERDASTS
jgi:hypothetical protein